MRQIFEYGDPNAEIVLIQPVDDHDMAVIENEVKTIRELTETEFLLRAVKVNSWNQDLSPWEAPAVFGNEDFGGGAEEMLGEVLGLCADENKVYHLGGYSLAGLFALWAGCQTDRFAGIAAASPSIWFPGFTGYMRENRMRCDAVYLSLGDKEPRTRNPVMSTVGDCIQEGSRILQQQGVRTTLEWNPGNHFRDPDLRTAKAFAWVMSDK